MLHKNYHDTACITGFVFKTKYLRGWKSKDERGEIETKKEKTVSKKTLILNYGKSQCNRIHYHTLKRKVMSKTNKTQR